MLERIALTLVSLLLSLAFGPADPRQLPPEGYRPSTTLDQSPCGYMPQGVDGSEGEGTESRPLLQTLKQWLPQDYFVISAQAGTVDFGDVPVGQDEMWDILITCINGPCWVEQITVYPEPPFYFLTVIPGLGIWVHEGEVIHVRIGFTPPYAGYFESQIEFLVCTRGGEHWDFPWFILRGRGISPNRPPVARCSYSPPNPTTKDTVYFSSSGSYDPDEGDFITSYYWDFGDGYTSSDPNPTHRYRRPGTYIARLTVRDREGASGTASCVVNVEEPPSPPILLMAAGGAAAAGAVYYAVKSIPPPLPAASAPAIGLAVVVPALALFLFPADQLIVSFKEKVPQQEAEKLLKQAIPGSRIIGYFPPINAYLVQFRDIGRILKIGDKIRALEAIQAQLNAEPFVRWTLKNYVGKVEGQPRDLERLAQEDRDLVWAYEFIRVGEAWDLIEEEGIRLVRVKVAVIDTGLAALHEEFQEVRKTGRSYVLGEDEEELPWNGDENGHGTRVSGIIAAANGQGRMNGILSGITENYELLMFRVLGGKPKPTVRQELQEYLAELKAEGKADVEKELLERLAQMGGTLSSVLDAISKAAKAGARVINISLGWDREVVEKPEELELIYDVFQAYMKLHPNVLFVTSAGNESIELQRGSKLHAPGGVIAPNNITVAALDKDGKGLADFSNYGEAVDLAAPGVDVYTTNNDGSYRLMSGTSAAAPMVTGTAALLVAIDPGLQPKEIKQILIGSGSGDPPVLDAAAASREAIASKKKRVEEMLRTLLYLGGAAVAVILLLSL